jgi:hypothetical protein
MRVLSATCLAVAAVLLTAAPLLAEPVAKGPVPAKGGENTFKSDRYALSVRGPTGWKKELEGAKSVGSWIDLVAYREQKTKAFLKISVQVSPYTGFEEMQKKLSAYYGGLSDITILRGPERLPPVMGVRGAGLYIEFARISGKRTDRSFLAYYINGRNTVRVWGTVAEKKFRNVETPFDNFLRSLRFFSRSVTSRKPNFIHESGKCALTYPEGWTVQIPARGAIAAFRGEQIGVKIWLYREAWTRGLPAYRTHRLDILNGRKTENVKAESPRAHEVRGEPVLVITYDQGSGPDRQQYREICLEHGGHVYRLTLGGKATVFERGLPALEKMVETLRFK